MATRQKHSVSRDLLTQALTLVVGWRRGNNVESAKILVGDEVGNHLRAACSTALDELEERSEKSYSEDGALDDDQYLLAPKGRVGPDHPVFASLDAGATLQTLDLGSLGTRPLVFYAALLGDTPKQRVAFLRKGNAYQAATRGKLFTTLRETLVPLKSPIFAFDDRIDMIVTPTDVVVFRLTPFDLLFRNDAAVIERVPNIVSGIRKSISMTDDFAESVATLCASKLRWRRRLLAIEDRSHLADVSPVDIRRELKEQGFDATNVFKRGTFVLSDEFGAEELLEFLNEDLVTGGLSHQAFLVERKTPR